MVKGEESSSKRLKKYSEYFSEEMIRCLVILFLPKKIYSALLTMYFILKLEQNKRFKGILAKGEKKRDDGKPSQAKMTICTTFPKL